MQRLALVSGLLWLAAVVATPSPASAQWQNIAPGIDYQEFDTGGHHLYVTRLDRNEPTVIVDTALAGDSLIQDRETVLDMANRSEGSLGWWDESWGAYTYDVVAAVNGSFFDLDDGEPWGGMIVSGWQVRRHDDMGGGSGLAWLMDGGHFIGECVNNRGERNYVTLESSGQTVEIDDINVGRGGDDLIMYTIHCDSDGATHTDGSGIEVLVRMDRPAGILPQPAGAHGTITAVRDGQGDTPVPFDHVVLSATGSRAATLRSAAAAGGGVSITQEPSHYEHDCNTSNPDDWTNTYATIGSSVHMVEDGSLAPYADATVRARTAFALNDSYAFLAVVDEISGSTGMTFDDFGTFLHDQLGADEAIAQDGGGSSTMVVDGQVMNHPSDGTPRTVANAILAISLQPATASAAFTTDTIVEADAGTALRLGPGNHYASHETVSQTEQGTVLDHDANGVHSHGGPWWLVQFGDGRYGWADEASLTYISGPVGDDDDDDTADDDTDDDDGAGDDDTQNHPPGSDDDDGAGGCECRITTGTGSSAAGMTGTTGTAGTAGIAGTTGTAGASLTRSWLALAGLSLMLLGLGWRRATRVAASR